MSLPFSPSSIRARAGLQAGLSLISVLVAIVIFSLGMLSIASIYTMAVPAVTANEAATDTAAFGNQFWALLQANPGLVNTLFGASPASGTKVQYQVSSQSAAPTSLQPLLTNIFSNGQTMLPNASVTITANNGADGNACSAATPTTTLCGITLNIQWQPNSTTTRSQTYNYQVGF
ncbi:putative Tfp pilus assembly protein PilV [Thiomonas sp. X19]|uniref:type IV pilus modification PilV family protein n=1 Tax=Thiomonas sp. X19 TaxID=1050370 RepID=UPI000B700742|nr:pilus assembly protein PilV [Thiomonas sp. X19]SCC91812.1 putative Tfp pilus assembly protein PilV [Thiomonas sp. X19]